jgi:cell division protein FtsZ
MSGAGSALMGTGSSRGDDRAVAAAEMAISSPLLEASIDGAHGVLLSIQGGSDLGLFEINEAAQLVSNSAAVDANIIFGAVIDDALGDEVRVTVIAAGLDENRTGRAAGGGSGTADSGGSSFSGNGSSGAVFGGSESGGAGSYGAAPRYERAVPDSGSPGDAGRGSGEGFGPKGFGTEGFGASQAMATSGGHGTSAVASADAGAAPGPGSAPSYGPVLSAPVPDDRAATPGGFPAEAPIAAPVPTAAAAPAEAADSSAYRLAHAEGPAKTFDVASTRRRPVVFEEDDDLDVPDFLK